DPAPADEVAACRAEIEAELVGSGAVPGGVPFPEAAKRALDEATVVRDAIGVPGPAARVQGWVRVSGAPWLVGMGLVLVGAWMARRRLAEEASGSGQATEERVHFQAAVGALRGAVDEIAATVADLPPGATAADVRERL